MLGAHEMAEYPMAHDYPSRADAPKLSPYVTTALPELAPREQDRANRPHDKADTTAPLRAAC
jgi:hypothetical protein